MADPEGSDSHAEAWLEKDDYFSYTDFGQLARSSLPGSLATTYTWALDGNLLARTWGSCVEATYAYDEAKRPTNLYLEFDGDAAGSFSRSLEATVVTNPHRDPLLDQAERLVDLAAARLPGAHALHPEVGGPTFLGLAMLPFEWVLHDVGVAPGGPEEVFVCLEARPLYCPGPFHLVKALGESRAVRSAFPNVGFPRLRLAPSLTDQLAEAVCEAVTLELPAWRARYSTPKDFLGLVQYEAEDLDEEELVAYSFLALGDLKNGETHIRRLTTAVGRRDESELAEGVRRRAQEMNEIIRAGQAAVNQKLGAIRLNHLESMGLEAGPDPLV